MHSPVIPDHIVVSACIACSHDTTTTERFTYICLTGRSTSSLHIKKNIIQNRGVKIVLYLSPVFLKVWAGGRRGR